MSFPHNWVILKISFEDEEVYKVLGGWSGGYLDSDYWQINSGIVKVEESDNHWIFYGRSGSAYHCNKNGYGLRYNTSGIYRRLVEEHPEEVLMLDENTDWTKLV